MVKEKKVGYQLDLISSGHLVDTLIDHFLNTRVVSYVVSSQTNYFPPSTGEHNVLTPAIFR